MSKTFSITPHLTVRDVETSARFYQEAFGFSITMMLPGGPKGKIMHAELALGRAKLMLGPESERRGIRAPVTSGATPPVSVYLNVGAVDEVHAQAVERGAIELLPPSDQFHGARTSIVCDPDGHQWMLAEQQAEKSDVKSKRRAARMGRGGAKAPSCPEAPRLGVRPTRV